MDCPVFKFLDRVRVTDPNGFCLPALVVIVSTSGQSLALQIAGRALTEGQSVVLALWIDDRFVDPHSGRLLVIEKAEGIEKPWALN